MAEVLARLVLIPGAFAVWIGEQRERWREWRARGHACCTKCHAVVGAEGLVRRRRSYELIGAAMGLSPNTPPLDSQLLGGPHDIACGVCGTTRSAR